MYNLVDLGLVVGTVIGFPLWCGLVLAMVVALAYNRSRRFRSATLRLIRRLVVRVEPLFKRPVLSHVTGNQGFPIQLEIFEHNLTVRIQALLFKLRDSFKIRR